MCNKTITWAATDCGTLLDQEIFILSLLDTLGTSYRQHYLVHSDWVQISRMFKSNKTKTALSPFYSCDNREVYRVWDYRYEHMLPAAHSSLQANSPLSSLPPPRVNETEKNIHVYTPVLPDAPPIRLLFLRNLGSEWLKCFLLLLGAKRNLKWVVYPQEWLNSTRLSTRTQPPSLKTECELTLGKDRVPPLARQCVFTPWDTCDKVSLIPPPWELRKINLKDVPGPGKPGEQNLRFRGWWWHFPGL